MTRSGQAALIGLIALFAVLAAIHFYQYRLLGYSGDEPRFAYYSYSIVKGEPLRYPPPQFVRETGSVPPAHTVADGKLRINPFNEKIFMMNSILAPALYSPALVFGDADHSWERLRTAAFLFYCAALVFVWLILIDTFSKPISIAALALTTLALPAIAQMSLGNTEQATLLFLVVALYYLSCAPVTRASTIIGTFSLVLIVFSSMRCVPISVAIGLGFVVRLWLSGGLPMVERRKAFLIFVAVTVVAAPVWAVYQKSLVGSLAGASLLNESPWGRPAGYFLNRFLVPLFNHRDGIFMLFPAVVLSFLGLANGARNRSLLAAVCLGMWGLYYAVIMLVSQNEGYAGRLQLVLVPALAVGLAFYIRDFRSVPARSVLVLATAISFLVVWFHLVSPVVFLENRQFGLAQQALLLATQTLDLGRYLIWDRYSCAGCDPATLMLDDSWRIGYKALAFLAVVVALLWISASRTFAGATGRIAAWCALLLSVVGAATLVVRPIPNAQVAVSRTVGPSAEALRLEFAQNIGGEIVVAFGPHYFWYPPAFPALYTVDVTLADGRTLRYRKISLPEVRLSVPGSIRSIVISGEGAAQPWSTNLDVAVFASPIRRLLNL